MQKNIFIMLGFLSKLVSFFDLRKKQDGSDEQGEDYLSRKKSKDVTFMGYKVKKAYPYLYVTKVNNFVRPRYVYHTLQESVEYDPSLGDVIGYRISDTLVIHHVVGVGSVWTKDSVKEFAESVGGACLDIREDIAVLRQYWHDISRMRVAIDDRPLPANCFWASNGWGLESVHYENDSCNVNSSYANIILKRNLI
jgi:hypothetical protein